MRARRSATGLLAVLVLVPALLAAIILTRFDLNQYAPMVIATVKAATGRDLTLGGPLKLKLSFTPVIEADDISISNPPGYASPDLLTLDHAEAQIALLPLLSHKISIIKLTLINPDITLERNQAGIANWDFSQKPEAAPGAPARGDTPHGYGFSLQSVEIKNCLLTVKDAKSSQASIVHLSSLTGSADSAAAPLKLAAQASFKDVPFTLNGTVGPVERFFTRGTQPWPINLTLAVRNATASINGAISNPRGAAGYDLSINAVIPALETLNSVIPAAWLNLAVLPPIHGLTANARLLDQDSVFPAIDNFSIKAAESDLSSLRPGLKLATLDIEMPSLNQPLTLKVEGAIGSQALTASGSLGAPARLLNPAWLPQGAQPQGNFPVAFQAQAGDAQFNLTGGIATPASYAGVALSLEAAIPNLADLSALAGTALPAWKNIALQSNVIDPGGLGLTVAAGLDDLVFTMDNAALGGDASFYFGSPKRLEAAVKIQQINLDALRAAMPAQAPAAASPLTKSAGGYMVSTNKLPLGVLKSASADFQVSADSVILNQTTYSAIQAHAVLADGILTINPFTALLPGGSVSANGTLNAVKEPAVTNVTIDAPALALGPFLRSLNLPDTAQGTMQARLMASGTGDSPHGILASVNGQLGLAMVNGTVDGAVLDQLFGAALKAVNLPASLLSAQGRVPVRCFALRLDATNGVGTIRALTLDSSRLLAQGGGSVNFGNETLNVVLTPQLQLAGNNLGVPVAISGTFQNPAFSVATLGALQQAAKSALGLPGTLTQQITGQNSLISQFAGAIGLGGSGDICPASLSLGRLGSPGPMPAAQMPANNNAPGFINGPKNLLKSLLNQ